MATLFLFEESGVSLHTFQIICDFCGNFSTSNNAYKTPQWFQCQSKNS
jgi:hypothetical protein